MTSWRDSASQVAQNDLDDLLNAVLPFAEELLGKNGEFYPFGAVVSNDGDARMTAGDPALGDHPLSNDVLATLYAGARAVGVQRGPRHSSPTCWQTARMRSGWSSSTEKAQLSWC